jgi:hypothetical protein
VQAEPFSDLFARRPLRGLLTPLIEQLLVPGQLSDQLLIPLLLLGRQRLGSRLIVGGSPFSANVRD